MRVKTRFRILHCLRAPVGGLFRHVCDLATAQSALGHEVAVVCAASGDPLTNERLEALSARLALGVHRISMGREIGLGDILATQAVKRLASSLGVDVLHGHGAKGGAYARLAAHRLAERIGKSSRPIAVYTPHGGSLHYAPDTLKGRVYMALERRLCGWTDAVIFESKYSFDKFRDQVGLTPSLARIVPNGVLPAEFTAVTKAEAPSTYLFIGELRRLKGVDLLLEAFAIVSSRQPATLTIVGAGPDADAFHRQANALGISDKVNFAGPMPARQAFALGEVLVMPSRAESFPYIVLEAAAAAVPLIATRVGGIPEITLGTDTALIEPENVPALAAAMFDALEAPEAWKARAHTLQERVRGTFSVGAMTEAVLYTYDAAAQRRVGERKILSA